MSRRASPPTRGQDLEQRLNRGLREADRLPHQQARDVPRLRGLIKTGVFIFPLANVVAEAGDLLLASRRVYRYGNSIVLETGRGAGGRLIPLLVDGQCVSNLDARLANLFICENVSDKGDVVQFPPPVEFGRQLLLDESVQGRLPEIRHYSTRPVFGEQFQLLQPGWNPDGGRAEEDCGEDDRGVGRCAESGVLVHGIRLEVPEPARDTPGADFAARCPHLERVLSGFCFRSETDRVNAIGLLLTVLLTPHFRRNPKPLVLVDGNQAGVGKTLLIRVLGMLLDGKDPAAIPFTPSDEELGKRVGAMVRDGGNSVLLIDNARVGKGGEIDSVFVEANSIAPEVTIRILGRTENLRVPNDFFWCVTMNNTRATRDLLSRSVPIRLHHEGDPRERGFSTADLMQYVEQHRGELLGELAAMIEHWERQGRELYDPEHRHRCGHWARLIGSILRANGFTGFLGNLTEAVTAFDSGQDALIALVETAWRDDRELFHETGEAGEYRARKSTELVPLFSAAGVLSEALASTPSKQAQATKVGNFLGPFVGIAVTVDLDGRVARVSLKTRLLQGTRRYWFDLEWGQQDAPEDAGTTLAAAALTPAAPTPVAPHPLDTGEPGAAATRSLHSEPPVAVGIPPGSGNGEDW